jgi:hypothetical protein
MNSPIFSPIKIFMFLIWFIAACGYPSPPPSVESNKPTVTPVEATIEPAVIESTTQTIENQSVINHTAMSPSEDYIIYLKYNPEDKQDEIWAINPNKLIPLLVTSGRDIYPWTRSPSKKLWLFTGGGSIYVSNPDGSDIRNVYTNNEYTRIYPFWISDDVVMFNAFRDIYSPPDMYRLEINTKVATQLSPGKSQFIQATFPLEQVWLQASWLDGTLEIVDQDGTAQQFFDTFSIVADYFNPNQIQRVNNLDKYLLSAKGDGDTNYKLWLVSDHEQPQMLFDPGSGGVDEFAVSPDEQFIALTYTALDDVHVYIFSLENLQLVYKWAYPYKLGNARFIWSPDSRSIALHYSESDVGTSNAITSGIQVMDIATGETRTILNEDVTQVLDWQFIE